MKKLFGGINLTWGKLFLFAIISGVYTALMAIIPELHYTSFNTIITTHEVWIMFGIIIIMNSKSNMDSALKCFVFFLISQPIIYLLQVPFSSQGWGLFNYYRNWIIPTLLCFPMGYIGYYMKKGKWWGYLILLPMILLTASYYQLYLSYFTFSHPKYLLICMFCISAMIAYPIYIFENKTIKSVGIIISGLLIVLISVLVFMNPHHYKTYLMINGETYKFDDTYKVYLEDDSYGKVNIVKESLCGDEEYVVKADFVKEGDTKIILEAANGDKTEYKLVIKMDKYRLQAENA